MTGTPVAPFIFVGPGVQFKPVEGDALNANGDLGQEGADLGVEAIAVHAEVARRVAETEESRRDRHVTVDVAGVHTSEA
jgi:hypothetical protein